MKLFLCEAQVKRGCLEIPLGFPTRLETWGGSGVLEEQRAAERSGAVEMTICWFSVMRWQRCTNLLAASRNSDTDSMHSTVFSIQLAAECADINAIESLNFDSPVPWFHSPAFLSLSKLHSADVNPELWVPFQTHLCVTTSSWTEDNYRKQLASLFQTTVTCDSSAGFGEGQPRVITSNARCCKSHRPVHPKYWAKPEKRWFSCLLHWYQLETMWHHKADCQAEIPGKLALKCERSICVDFFDSWM